MVRLLVNYYANSMACVENNGMRSRIFRTTRGVKQGGCLSPFLFAIYFNDMVTEIIELGLGVSFNNLLIDILLYADDILLVSESKTNMLSMLNVMSNFGINNEIKFNPNKTVYTIFNSKLKKTR